MTTNKPMRQKITPLAAYPAVPSNDAGRRAQDGMARMRRFSSND